MNFWTLIVQIADSGLISRFTLKWNAINIITISYYIASIISGNYFVSVVNIIIDIRKFQDAVCITALISTLISDLRQSCTCYRYWYLTQIDFFFCWMHNHLSGTCALTYEWLISLSFRNARRLWSTFFSLRARISHFFVVPVKIWKINNRFCCLFVVFKNNLRAILVLVVTYVLPARRSAQRGLCRRTVSVCLSVCHTYKSNISIRDKVTDWELDTGRLEACHVPCRPWADGGPHAPPTTYILWYFHLPLGLWT